MSEEHSGRRLERVAVIAPNWLGDAVMALPAIADLGANAALDVIAPAYTARVFWRAPGVREVWIDPGGGRATRIRARVAALRACGVQAAVVLPPSWSSAVAPFLARVPRRVGYRSDGRRVLLSDAPAPPGRDRHLVTSYRELAGRLFGVEAAAAQAAHLHVSAADREAALARLQGAAVAGDYALLVPGAAFGPAKAWPAERYHELCHRLSRDLPVVVTGGVGDRGVCARVAEGVRGAVSLAGETGLGEFFALAERARVVVANDSGAPHVSAAMGTPTVVLFGSTSPAWTAPHGDAVVVLQHVVHCNPCFHRTCPTQLECFNGIAVDEVEAAVHRVVAPAASRV